jgi:F-box domain
MFALSNLLPSSTSGQQLINIPPHELKMKILSYLPVKTLAISRLVSPIWKTFVDTYFTEVPLRQFLVILQKCPIAHPKEKSYFSYFALTKIVKTNFEKALELEKNLIGQYVVDEAIDDLVENADSKEKIFKLFNLLIEGQSYYFFFQSIQPLIKRYFSILASLKKEQPETIVDNFNEALSVLKKFYINQEVHLLIGLYLVETYPEHIKNQQDAVLDSLQLKDNCFYIVEARRVIQEFSFSKFLNFLVIAKFFSEKYEQSPYFFEMITTREDALAFLRIGGTNVQKFVKHKQIYKHLNFFDLLQAATLLLEEIDTYQFYRKILKQAESAGEFEIGLQKLLERKPQQEQLKEYLRLIIPIILDETPTHHLSSGVYEILLHYPDSGSLTKTFLRIASICEINLHISIVDRIRQMQELNDDMRSDIMALEIKMGDFERAKQTFCSIKNPEAKDKAAARFSFFIEKEDWDYFDIFFKELHAFFNQKLTNEISIFSELIKQVAKKDVNKALNLVKSYWTGYLLASFLIIIAKEQKNQKTDFLPLVFEARSLVTSLVTSNEDASQALSLLKELLELQEGYF